MRRCLAEICLVFKGLNIMSLLGLNSLIPTSPSSQTTSSGFLLSGNFISSIPSIAAKHLAQLENALRKLSTGSRAADANVLLYSAEHDDKQTNKASTSANGQKAPSQDRGLSFHKITSAYQGAARGHAA